MKHYVLIETCVDAEDKNTAVEKPENVLRGKPQGVEYEASVVLNADSKHKAYLQYLSRWIFEHYEDEFQGCSPAGYDEWLDCEGESYYEDNSINGMEPERYLASLLLADSSYKGEKYYEKEDEYTEIIKENKHLLLNNNDNSLIDKGDDGDKKYNIYEYKNLTPKQLREMYRNVTGLNNDEEFTNQEIVKYLLDALQETEKVDNNEDGPIDEEDAFIWKVSYGEYELAEDGGIILDSTAASVFYVGDLVKVVFEDEEDQIGIYRVVKVTDTQCICEFVK